MFITYDNASWNVDQIKAMSEMEFIEKMQAMYSHLSEDDRIAALRNVYKYIVGPITAGEPESKKEQE